MPSLTERLRASSAQSAEHRLRREAADEIDRLTAEVRELNREVCLHTCTVRACHFDGTCERAAPSDD